MDKPPLLLAKDLCVSYSGIQDKVAALGARAT